MKDRWADIGTPEKRRAVWMGRTAPEAFASILQFLPQVGEFTLVSYCRRLRMSNYGNLEMYPISKSFLSAEVVAPSFWQERFDELRKIELPYQFPDLTASEVAEYWRDQEVDMFLAVQSLMEPRSGDRLIHIPQMDFRPKPSPENLEGVKRQLRERGETAGIILDSGGSYHYYGLRTLAIAEWRSWMTNWFWTLADNWFIAYSLAENHSLLRLTSGISKRVVPVVVGVI